MVVVAPARDIGPRDRSILAAADLKRPRQTRIWDKTRRCEMRTRARRVMGRTRAIRGKWSQRQRGGDHRERGGISSEATRVSERCPVSYTHLTLPTKRI